MALTTGGDAEATGRDQWVGTSNPHGAGKGVGAQVAEPGPSRARRNEREEGAASSGQAQRRASLAVVHAIRGG